MAKKSNTPDEKIIINQIQIAQVKRGTWDMKKLKDAITAAEKPDNPKRVQLYTIFEDIRLDSHLKAVTQKRKYSILNTKIEFVKPGQEGKDETIQAIIERSWFIKMLGFIMEEREWGHSLMEFQPDLLKPELGIGDVILIPRMHVIPELGIVALKQGDTTGIPFREPPYSPWLMEVGEKRGFGYLLEAAALIIFKRNAFGNWAQFAELFGMPFRKATFNPHDENSRIKLKEAMENAASAAYAVIPEGTNIEFISNGGSNNNSSNVYSGLIETCNKEISKLVLGNTMTTEDGSSKSQAEVHAEVEDALNRADRQWIEFILNDKLVPILVNTFGLKQFEGGHFKFDDSDDLDTQLERDVKLAGVIDIDPNHFANKYNVPLAVTKTGSGGTNPKK